MYKVKVIGAGSIGNHMTYACRSNGWDVTICDLDPTALERTKNDIYPSRYGNWDEGIRLAQPQEVSDESFDVVIIGTPPDTHIAIAMEELTKNPPKVMMIEKPLATPSLEGCQKLFEMATSGNTRILTGYNHTLTANTALSKQILETNMMGEPLTITALVRENWSGIFAAHPWLDGPGDTYLGFSARGGGASGEHSHGINIWQHFAHLLDMGRIVEVSATLDIVDDEEVHFDRLCLLNVKTEKGLVGNITQDVVTEPPLKKLRVQSSEGFLEWVVNHDKENDAVFYRDKTGKDQEKLIPKKRPDDFAGEIRHIGELLKNPAIASPIALERGLDTMMVLAAAHLSHDTNRKIQINYDKGYVPEALEII